VERLKLLFVAVVVAALGGWYLSQRAEAGASKIRQEADERLREAAGPVNSTLAQDGQVALASVKAAAQGSALAQAMDAEGKPDAATLEAARGALERGQSPEAERPVLIVVSAQGVVGRYHVGQSNRIDSDLTAFPPLSNPAANPGSLARAGIAVLDGEPYRFALAQFEDSKAQGGKGLLLVGFPIDDAFAQRLQTVAGAVDISLVDSGKVLGSTLPPAERQALQLVASNTKGAVNFGALSGDRFVITNLVPPLAPYLKLPIFPTSWLTPQTIVGHRYRGRALATPPELSPEVKVIAAVKTTESFGVIADEQREVLLGIAGIALLCIILALATRNPMRGLDGVVTAAERVAQGDKEARAPTVKMSSLVRRAAVAINTLASQVEGSAKPPSQAPGDLAEQLGIRPVRNTGSLVAIPALPSEGGEPESLRVPAGFASSQPSPTTLPPIPYGGPGPTRKSNPSLEPMVLPQKPKPMAAPIPASQAETEGAYNPDATVIVQAPQVPVPTRGAPASSPLQRSSSSQVPPSAASPVPLPSPFAAGAEEAHFQQVYREFVATKEKCGEPADGLTYDKFAAKLRKNQEQLIAKYACRAVRFQVYVKDGKTALKAQPIK